LHGEISRFFDVRLTLKILVTNGQSCVISDFRREVAENCALLGYYAASNGNFLPTFWEVDWRK